MMHFYTYIHIPIVHILSIFFFHLFLPFEMDKEEVYWKTSILLFFQLLEQVCDFFKDS